MLPPLAKLLLVVGSLGMFVAWSLFIRMIVDLNKVLPPNERFSIIEFRLHMDEIKRLHEEAFPVSALRASWIGLIVGSVITIAASILVAIKPM